MKFKVSKPLKGRIRAQRSDRLANLIYNGIIPLDKRYKPTVYSGYSFNVYLRKLHPRFAITREQKMFNYLIRIKWDDLPPITIHLDDFELAEDL